MCIRDSLRTSTWRCILRQLVAIGELVSLPVVVLASFLVSHFFWSASSFGVSWEEGVRGGTMVERLPLASCSPRHCVSRVLYVITAYVTTRAPRGGVCLAFVDRELRRPRSAHERALAPRPCPMSHGVSSVAGRYLQYYTPRTDDLYDLYD